MESNEQSLIVSTLQGEGVQTDFKVNGLLSWLHSFSNFELGLALLGLGLTLALVLPYAVRLKFKLEPSEPVAKGAEESFKVLISLTLLLMAFSLVRLQGDHRSVDDLVSREATVILKLERAYTSFGGPDEPLLRDKLLAYSKVLVNGEWEILKYGQRSDVASDLLAELSVLSKALDPQTAPQQIARAEILAGFTQLSDLREARLSATRLALPDYLWHAIAVCMFFLMILAWFQAPLKKAVPYVGGVVTALMILLTVLIATGGIFASENATSSQPIAQAISLIEAKQVRLNKLKGS